ncbi:MAG: glycosyltransferase family 4 protein [Pseudomonadota bacterium]
MTRLLFLVDAFPPILGGVATSSARICKELQGRGFSITVLSQKASEDAAALDEIDGLQVRRFSTAHYPCSSRSFVTLGLHHLLEDTTPFDAVISFQATAAASLGSLFSRIRSIPHVVCCRGSDINRKSVDDPEVRFLTHSSLVRADLVFSVSQEIAQRVIALGIAPDKVLVVPNSVDTDLFHPLDSSPAYDFLLTGPAREFKGFDTVFEAAVELKRPCKILAVLYDHPSHPGHLPRLRELARRCPDHVSTDFVPAVPHSEMPDIYCRARCLIQPSHSEGCSNVVLEALACGRDVIVRSIPSLTSILDDTPTGFSTTADLVVQMNRHLDRHWRVNDRNLGLVKARFSREVESTAYAQPIEALIRRSR